MALTDIYPSFLILGGAMLVTSASLGFIIGAGFFDVASGLAFGSALWSVGLLILEKGPVS